MRIEVVDDGSNSSAWKVQVAGSGKWNDETESFCMGAPFSEG